MSVCFFVPYFGKFPEWFPFWLKTCERNEGFHWIVITDDKRSFSPPPNVKIVYTTLEELRDRFSKKLGFEVSLEKSYKLCDYKPLYGFLFQEELKDFTHWGYTDMDVLWGDLSKFITKDLLEAHHKIQKWGHLSIYQNIPEINEAFRYCDYKRILTTPVNMIFDEPSRTPNINQILEQQNWKVLGQIKHADMDISPFNFVFIDSMHRSEGLRHRGAVFEYLDGKIHAYYLENGVFQKEEYAYVHFQKRKISVQTKVSDAFLMVPNEIIPWEPVGPDVLQRYKKGNCIYYIQKKWNRLSWRVKNEWQIRKKSLQRETKTE